MKPICCPKCREKVRTELSGHAAHFGSLAKEREGHDLWAKRVYAVLSANLERYIIDLCGPTPRPKAKKKRSNP